VSVTFVKLKKLIANKEVLISSHGYDELAEDDILIHDIIVSFEQAKVIEDYPNFGKGPCVLLLQYDCDHKPVHTVWGIPKDKSTPAVLITAYRPDPKKWSNDFTRRR